MRLLTAVVLALFVLPAPVSAQLSLTWDPVEHVEGYTIYGSTEPTHPQWAVDVESVTTWTYRTGQPGARYYFWVAAWRTAETTEFGVLRLRSPFGEGQPINGVYEGSTAPPPPPPPGGGTPPPPPPPPPDPIPSALPVLMPPATECVTPEKDTWALVSGPFGYSVFFRGGYLTHADQLNCRDLGVTMRQGAVWYLWDRTRLDWTATGDVEASPPPPPPVEMCGDKIDNDGDGQIDEPDAGCLPDPPPPPDPCVTEPLRVTVSAWPKTNLDATQLRYDPTHAIRSVMLAPGTTTTRSAVFTDTRGCTVTVK